MALKAIILKGLKFFIDCMIYTMEPLYLLLRLTIQQKFFDHVVPFIKMEKCKVKVRQMITDSECVEAYKRNWR